MRRLLPAIISLICILGCVVILLYNEKPEEIINRSEIYLASEGGDVTIYCLGEEDTLQPYTSLCRGTAVSSRNRTITLEDEVTVMTEIELDGQVDENGEPLVFYVKNSDYETSRKSVVREKTRYVRTDVTIYADDHSAEIISFAEKGTELSVMGFSGLNDDGTVNMYLVTNGSDSGYVYGKYLTDSQEEADALYSLADIHSGRSYDYELYGGSAENLDYYPYEKASWEDNPLLTDGRCIYVNGASAALDSIDDYIDLALSSGANALVVDIKDNYLSYESLVAQTYSPVSYAHSLLTFDEYASSIQKIKDAGLYVIGRIVVFNDEYYAQDHPEECIESYVSDALWPSAYSRNCWYYNVALAIEAVENFGFNEIQFDYVRFPESAYSMSESEYTDFKNVYGEEKAEAIQNFCYYAADQMHRVGAYISVDVFGECVNEYVTAYGQYWPAISNVVDVISGMPYTDHFGSETDTWSDPYTTVYEWALMAAQRQSEIENPAVARTWITGYDTPNWDPYITYGENSLLNQRNALEDAGLSGGFIPWNGGSYIDKYYSYSAVWAE